MVERVTSNDEVAGSIPSEGTCDTSEDFLHFLVVMVVVVLLVKRRRLFFAMSCVFSGLASLEL